VKKFPRTQQPTQNSGRQKGDMKGSSTLKTPKI